MVIVYPTALHVFAEGKMTADSKVKESRKLFLNALIAFFFMLSIKIYLSNLIPQINEIKRFLYSKLSVASTKTSMYKL